MKNYNIVTSPRKTIALLFISLVFLLVIVACRFSTPQKEGTSNLTAEGPDVTQTAVTEILSTQNYHLLEDTLVSTQLPTESSSSQQNSSSPVIANLWRFESSPDVVDGLRTYYAYAWLEATDDIVMLTKSEVMGISSQDFGLCIRDSTLKGGENPYIETSEGNRYNPTWITCDSVISTYSDKGIFLFPGVRVAGKELTQFLWIFEIPYKEDPNQLVFPGIGTKVELPKIDELPFNIKIPSPDNSKFNSLGEYIEVNETFDIEVEHIELIPQTEDDSRYYIAPVKIKIKNKNAGSNFQFTIDRYLIDSNGMMAGRAESANVVLDKLDDPSVCPNRNTGSTEALISIPAGSEIVTNLCFFIYGWTLDFSSSEKINLGIPEYATFFITLDDATMAFYGKIDAP